VTQSSLTIACEVNPPRTGVDRRCAGVLLTEGRGQTYLGHTGKIGGGRAGIGKAAFFERYSGALERVVWPDGQESDVILIGPVDGSRLPEQLALFVRQSARIKQEIVAGGDGDPPLPPASSFAPEFSGPKAAYRIAGLIEARADHGLVVNALHQELLGKGIAARNDRERDLFVESADGSPGLLFEVKTSIDTGSLYTGVGQLMFHGAVAPPAPQPVRVLVVPGRPEGDTLTVLTRLGIRVLTFELHGAHVTFDGLDAVLG
jgi:hypothetical protein